MIKKLLYVFVILFLTVFVAFYFWGSSPNLDESEYHQIIQFETQSTHSKSDTISIMSYNIGYLSGMINNLPIERTADFFNENFHTAIELFQNETPDIIAFQEIDYFANRSFYMDQFSEIANEIGYQYGAKSINWDMKYVPFPYLPLSMNFGRIISGQAILSQYPILKLDHYKFEKPESNPFYYNQFYIDRLLQISVIDLGQPVYIINAHLEAFKRGAREDQMRILVKVLAPYFNGQPLILLGDFNSVINDPKDQTISILLDAFPIYEVSRSSDGNYPDTKGTYSTESPTKKIDHIFYTHETIQLIDWKIPNTHVEGSDHLPIKMRFTLKNITE